MNAQRPSTSFRGWERFRSMLYGPVDGASLAVFRIGFGLVMVWHALKHLWPQPYGNLAQYYYVDPGWTFPYHGFEWVRPWPEPLLTAHFILLAAAALCVAIGLFYRAAAVLLFVSYLYVFLLDEARYNNHYYLMCLMQFLLIWMPAQERFSIDSWWKSRKNQNPVATNDGPKLAPLLPAGTVPFWCVFLLRAQLFVLYFYGGIAKINVDWLTGTPLLTVGRQMHAMLDGLIPLPDWIKVTELCLFLAYSGLIYDLSIGFLLLFRRTRILGIVLTLMFHTINNHMFPIGVFPAMAFAATLIFLEPDWPLQFWRWLKRPRMIRPEPRWLLGGALVLPVVGAALGWKRRSGETQQIRTEPVSLPKRRAALSFVCVWLAVQTLVPLRHNFIEGDANWTEEGHRFSWRMMLRAKAAGHVVFDVHDPKILATGADGKTRIDWDNWPDDAHAVYASIDSHKFEWSHHPGLMVTHEPCLGPRVIYNLNATPSNTIAMGPDRRGALERQWLDRFGRRPTVHETISIQDALSAARKELEEFEADDHADAETLAREKRRIDAMLSLFTMEGQENKLESRQRFVMLCDEMQRLVESACGPVVRKHLRRIHPFALQGASPAADRTFLVVDDPQLWVDGRARDLQKLSGGDSYIVWIDLSRLRPEAWRDLPQSLVTFGRDQPQIVWNHFHELNSIQIERFSVRPYMLHQYGRHVAELWDQKTGRLPEVRVSSLVMLNYHTPRYLIDPEIDLVHTPYDMVRHNRWILPHTNLDSTAPNQKTLLQQADELATRKQKTLH